MSTSVKRDLKRFNDIVKGNIRQNLRKFMTDDSLVGRRGKDLVSIPVPQINLPHFRFGDNRGGVGQGEGEEGDVVGKTGEKGGSGAGISPGRHLIEVELTLEELAEILGEQLELPNIKPKQRAQITGEVHRYTGARRVGPESLRYMKRTYMAALRRSIISGVFDYENPVIVPIRDDKRYRSWKNYPCPENNAVIFYMLDVSGSMFSEKKRLVRITAFWIDLWIRHHYQNCLSIYIAHDMQASEVDYDTFFSLKEDGGTQFSSAYNLCNGIIDTRYSPNDWNLYAFHFSDGDNFSYDDEPALEALRCLQKKINLFCYAEVFVSGNFYYSPSSTFKSKVDAEFCEGGRNKADNVITSQIKGEDGILDTIKTFLGKGY